jgi:hypothetical protein
MKKLSTVLIFIFLSILTKVHSQATKSDPVDSQGWFSAGLDLNLPKKWKAEIEYQARTFNDFKSFNGSFYSIGVEKELASSFSLLAEYRLSKVLKGTYNRISAGFVLNKKLENVKFDLRVLYQNQVQDFDDPTKEIDRDNFVRIRLRMKKELSKKVDMIIAFEPIYQVQQGLKIDNYRIQGGLRYNFTKKSSVDVFYINRPDYGKSYKRVYHILGLSFKQEIKF